MCRFLVKLILFALFAGMIYLVLLLVQGERPKAAVRSNLKYVKGGYGHMYTRCREVRANLSTDILVLGSSHAYRGFDPRIFDREGYRLFNLGSSSQTPLQMQVLLDEHLDALDPDLCLIEVFPNTFQNLGKESALDLASNCPTSLSMAIMALQTKDIVVSNTLAYSWALEQLGWADEFVEPSVNARLKDRYIPGGFVEYGDPGYRKVGGAAPKQWDPAPTQIVAFERCLTSLGAKGAKVVFVFAPVMPSFQPSPNVQAALTSYFSSKGQFYDMSALFLPSDTSLFRDDHHLNALGVERFNEFLITRLKNDGYLLERHLSNTGMQKSEM